jgi:predicted DCC family thiol-disulfide oxidoreductase YuxK
VALPRENFFASFGKMSDEPAALASASRSNVLLYDGECGLCNAVVRFLLRHDRRKILHFSPLQGPTSQRFLRSRNLNTENFDSLVFAENLDAAAAQHWTRTAAILEIIRRLGGGWKILLISRLIPASGRDALYRLIARTRYRLFREYRPRPLPNPAWEKRFIDPPAVTAS